MVKFKIKPISDLAKEKAKIIFFYFPKTLTREIFKSLTGKSDEDYESKLKEGYNGVFSLVYDMGSAITSLKKKTFFLNENEITMGSGWTLLFCISVALLKTVIGFGKCIVKTIKATEITEITV